MASEGSESAVVGPGVSASQLDSSFCCFGPAHGLMADLSYDSFPTILSAWSADVLSLDDAGTHFGYVLSGQTTVNATVGMYSLQPGMYFSLPSAGSITSTGQGIVVTRLGYRGVFLIGGPIEAQGRLHYIDNCTDSLLLPPTVKGDPCLNALYFPAGVWQTPHRHPSLRVGMVVSGSGECITPRGKTPMLPGQVFLIPAGGLHSFRTTETPMVVVVYHPDSDFGPTDESHPMINRTLIDGVSASPLAAPRGPS